MTDPMSGDYFYGDPRKGSGSGSGRPSQPEDRRGRPAAGRIVRLMVGQGHGTIRLSNGRDGFFHRADVQEGSSFHDLEVGDSVRFELVDDAVSGARALRVVRHSRSR